MPLASRRQFVQQTALAAASLYGPPVTPLLKNIVEGSAQGPAPVDAASIRKFASSINGQVIMPDAPEYETARVIFNRAFDRHPALIVRCAGPSDVARALD